MYDFNRKFSRIAYLLNNKLIQPQFDENYYWDYNGDLYLSFCLINLNLKKTHLTMNAGPNVPPGTYSYYDNYEVPFEYAVNDTDEETCKLLCFTDFNYTCTEVIHYETTHVYLSGSRRDTCVIRSKVNRHILTISPDSVIRRSYLTGKSHMLGYTNYLI